LLKNSFVNCNYLLKNELYISEILSDKLGLGLARLVRFQDGKV